MSREFDDFKRNALSQLRNAATWADFADALEGVSCELADCAEYRAYIDKKNMGASP